MTPRLIIVLLLFVLFLVILAQNSQVVTLRLLFWKVSMSQIILLLLTVVFGFALGLIAAKVAKSRKRG